MTGAQVHRPAPKRLRRFLAASVRLGLLLSATVAATLLYCYWVQVPDFITTRVLASLRERGLIAEIGRLRLHGCGFVAEKVRLSPVDRLLRRETTFERVVLKLDRAALIRGRFEPRTLTLSEGGSVWWQSQSNTAPRQIALPDLETQLRFLPDDQWELSYLTSRVQNLQVHLTASLTHASSLRSWAASHRPSNPSIDWAARVEELLTQLQKLDLTEGSILDVHVRGDALEPASVAIELRLAARHATLPYGRLDAAELIVRSDSPNDSRRGPDLRWDLRAGRVVGDWGELRTVKLVGELFGSLTNLAGGSVHRLDWELQAATVRAQALTAQNFVVIAETLPLPRQPGTFRSDLTVRTAVLETAWATSASNRLTASLVHTLRLSDPWELVWGLDSLAMRSSEGKAAHLQLSGRAAPRWPLAEWQPVSNSPGVWARLEPFDLEWHGQIDGIAARGLEIDVLTSAGQWRAPDLTIETFKADLYDGTLQTSAHLDVTSRELRSAARIDFDLHRLDPVLPEPARTWLKELSWERPPIISTTIRLLLPNSRQPGWTDAFWPSLELAGEFTASAGAFHQVPLTGVQAHFSLTNMIWALPNLDIQQSDGRATLAGSGNAQTGDFKARLESGLNPTALRPLFEAESAQSVLDQFKFSTPPTLQGDVQGRWQELQSLSCTGRVVATNFLFHGERCSQLAAALRFRDTWLQFSDVTIRHDTQQITVPSGSFDLTERVVYVTNVLSTMDPDLVTRVIGPKVRAAVRPYHFNKPPTVRVNGRLPTFDTADAAVRFEVVGEDFSYWKLRLPSVTGEVYWQGDSLSISNVHGSFYGGELAWRGEFDFSVPVGANFSFLGTVRNADFHSLMVDLEHRTNQLQGTLDGQLNISNANSDDWHSWQGSGVVRLRNGFLWEIPIFGFFSPVLNTFVPGLGKSPVSAGDANFTIDQSVVHTRNLELQSPALRLRYSGSVDFKGVVTARMRAEIMRNAWAIGRIVSAALWPISKAFEYKVSGTLYHPKAEPVYIPKALLVPLHPVKTLRQLFAPVPADSEDRAEPTLEPSDTVPEDPAEEPDK